jgi:ATP-dependent RNA helicase DDX52/ROK1
MDALKLLSRSTRQKSKDQNSSSQFVSVGSETPFVQDTSTIAAGRKRKRDSELDVDNGRFTSEALSEQEIRALHKRHHIKIVDLDQFRALGKSSDSRKAQKEQSRIFPQPVSKFSELRTNKSINAALLRNITDQAYHSPTDVQIAALSLQHNGSSEKTITQPNLLTIAPTGSGKTLAFLVPLIDKISKSHHQDHASAERHVHAIIMAPTKELVFQIVNEGRKLATKTGVSITALKRGMRLFETGAAVAEESGSDVEEDDLEARIGSVEKATLVKSDILVSTPLGLVHLIGGSDEDGEQQHTQSLPQITDLVFDEADVLLDPLFRSQTLAVWSACTSPELRISLWSATIGSNIEELAVRTISERHKRLKIPRADRPSLIRIIIGLKDTSLPTISHRLIYTSTESGKLLGVRQLLRPSHVTPTAKDKSAQKSPPRPPFLVFTQTIERAQSLFSELQYDIPAEAGGSSRIAVLHSQLSHQARSTIMKNFRQGKIWVLITTDLLSRGVDFRGVNAVVNYDIPTTVAGYVHRAGRTGRAGREGGVCVSFYTKEDIQYVKGIANVIAASEKRPKTPESTIADSDIGGVQGPGSTSSTDIQPWLLHALPDVSKSARRDLKMHGVTARRAIHADDDEKTKRMKRKAKIGTQSGYERRQMDRKRGAVEGSRKAKERQAEHGEKETWEGFG